jgi:serine/threonine protein kinase
MAHEPQQQPEPEFDPEELAHAADGADNAPGSDPQSAPAAPVNSSDLIGQTLEGRYRFDALLGEGTFARVYRVYDLHRRVYLAAKVLRSDIAQEPMFLERFKREARVLETLQHPHIVRYYDIVESGDIVFILTDFIDGRTLQTELKRQGGPMNPQDSLTILTPLAAALHYAHREGVIHRDLKPSNILIDDNDNLYVMDFGIARILSDSSTMTVDTTSTVGTPHYMSPEQIMVGEVTPTTDVYALGVMLYQMYTGRLPFVGESQGTMGSTTAMRIVYEHLHKQPVPPTQLNPSLSKAVEEVVLKCLEKDPTQRYQTVSDVYDALTEAIGTPSRSLDAEEVAEVVQPVPEAERVPTGVGGASRIVQERDYHNDDDYADDEYPDDDYDHLAYGADWREFRKRKRELKRDAHKAKREARGARMHGGVRFGDDDAGELGEKQREKQQESDEKSEEKSSEKGTEVNFEKGEFWVDFAPSDRLSQFTFGSIVVWAGLVLLLGDTGVDIFQSDRMAWLVGGAGAMLLAAVAARLVIPEFRAKPGARLVFGVILLMVGFGLGFGFGAIWPLILIGIGISLVINQLFSD